jgi:hypothetical protein
VCWRSSLIAIVFIHCRVRSNVQLSTDRRWFEIVLGRQSYERLAEKTWRCRSAGFEADLTVDEDWLVENYYVWRAVARA